MSACTELDLPGLLATLETLGIRLSLRLVIDAPRGVLTNDLKAALAAHKPLLVARLAAADIQAPRPEALPWDILAALRWGTTPAPASSSQASAIRPRGESGRRGSGPSVAAHNSCNEFRLSIRSYTGANFIGLASSSSRKQAIRTPAAFKASMTCSSCPGNSLQEL